MRKCFRSKRNSTKLIETKMYRVTIKLIIFYRSKCWTFRNYRMKTESSKKRDAYTDECNAFTGQVKN